MVETIIIGFEDFGLGYGFKKLNKFWIFCKNNFDEKKFFLIKKN